MATKLHSAGRAYALQLVADGKVDDSSPWDFTAADEDKLLGDPPDWKAYAQWFMGQDTEADGETKAAWKYPFGKDGKVYRSALRAIRTRAAQNNETEISDAARECMDKMDEMATMDAIAAAAVRATTGTRIWYEVKAGEGDAPEEAAINIFDIIGTGWFEDGVTTKQFAADLAALPASVKTLNVHVNSPGGEVFEALGIANALKQHKAKVVMHIDGLAASAATIVTSGGGDVIKIADNALVMVHSPYGFAMGNAKDMRATADALDRSTSAILTTYQRHSELSRDELAQLMEDVTWMDADEAVANGFATEKVASIKAAACIDQRVLGALPKVPERFVAMIQALTRKPEAEAKPEPTQVPKADAAPVVDVLRICAEADLDIRFAQALAAEGLALEPAQARVAAEKDARAQAKAREVEIRALCKVAKQDELADGYVKGAMGVEDVRAHLATITAKLDKVEVESGASGRTITGKAPVIDIQAIYAERNRLASPKPA